MSETFVNQAIVIFGLVLIVLELFFNLDTGFDLLIFGTIIILSGFFGLIFSSIWLTLGLITLVSLLYIFFLRKKFKEKIVRPLEETYSIDALIGTTATVTQEISPKKTGKIKLNGQIWRARSKARCKVGEKVKVEKIKGITLFVKKGTKQ